ncbi:MAG: NADH-quinone oxidoreductase subunit C, partial [Candidatus Omnitrophica bacterium]|nr:NADH-quinone oxidoreductase subunit C [Candidatus Omnitrophota bacterium]
MDNIKIVSDILASKKIDVADLAVLHRNELYIAVSGEHFVKACNLLHKAFNSPVMMLFAEDMRPSSGVYMLYCVFLNVHTRCWIFVRQEIAPGDMKFYSLAKDIYSASLFEREVKEMFGIEPSGNPDARRLKLHNEVWPGGYYPLRKDFIPPRDDIGGESLYQFKRVEGEGVFEVPVGPVHAGIIGPGHFRFSVAGEPIINLETRLGWTHRGVEKLLEGKDPREAVKIFECVSGDTAFGYSQAFCQSVEKVLGLEIPDRAQIIRVLCLELERLYNHANDMGGIALDVGFSFPAQFASLVKENILQLNQSLSLSRYLKGINAIGGVEPDIGPEKIALIQKALPNIQKDLLALEEMLFSSVSFMDRVDTTGTLRVTTARDLGVTGVAARASGIALDMRKGFPGAYGKFSFNIAKEHSGDVAARLKVRCIEAKESISLVRQCIEKLGSCEGSLKAAAQYKEGIALGV